MYRSIAFSDVADQGVLYFDSPWIEREVPDTVGCYLFGAFGGCWNVKYKASPTMITSGRTRAAGSSTVTVPMSEINTGPFPPPARRMNGEWVVPPGVSTRPSAVTTKVPERLRDMKLIFDCAVARTRMVVSSGTWHSTTLNMPATDVSAVEVQNVAGQPRRFDVTCWYAFPATVRVDFPRQTRPDNRDIGVNLAGDGFYRVYDMNRSLWGQMCRRDCEATEQFIGPGSGGDFTGGNYENRVNMCISSCISRGW